MTVIGGPLSGAAPLVLSLPELRARAEALGTEELPVVLGRDGGSGGGGRAGSVRPGDDVREALFRRRGLTADGGDEVAEPAAEWVHTLVAADEELAARRISDAGTARLCVARRSGSGRMVVASRPAGDDAAVTLAPAASRVGELLRFLGSAAPAEEVTARAPLELLAAGLAAGDGFAGCAAAFSGVGVARHAAGALAAVLTTTTSWTEVVRGSRQCGSSWHTPAAMVVYDSAHGRLVAVPDRAPDGRLWLTFGPGDHGRVGRGIDALDGLSGSASA